jgi:DNA polymerase-3 subunit epsilon
MILKRPLIFFDLESTGLDVSTERIVEIACIKIDLDGNRTEKCTLINPTIPIPKEASDVHGITDEKVANAPKFIELSKSLYNFFKDCDIAGFNSDNYDIPLLVEEFSRCNIIFGDWELNTVDVYRIEKLLRPTKLSDVYKRYTGNDLKDAHSALADVNATLEILFHQYEGKDEVTPEEMENFYRLKKRYDLSNKMFTDEQGVVYWNFGKYANKPIETDMKYVDWVLQQKTFSEETKRKINDYFNRDKVNG